MQLAARIDRGYSLTYEGQMVVPTLHRMTTSSLSEESLMRLEKFWDAMIEELPTDIQPAYRKRAVRALERQKRMVLARARRLLAGQTAEGVQNKKK